MDSNGVAVVRCFQRVFASAHSLEAVYGCEHEGSTLFSSSDVQHLKSSCVFKSNQIARKMKCLLCCLIFLSTVVCKAQKIDSLTSAEKIYGLSCLWTEAKYNFANFKISPDTWDSIYLDYIPKVSKSKSTYEYYQCLISFYALLEDGHTNVYYPTTVSKNLVIHPLRADLIEGKVIVTEVLNDTLERMGISPGTEILEINGMEAIAYGQKKVMPFVSASTEQYKISEAYGQSLFLYQRHKPFKMKVKSREGTVKDIVIDRFMSYKPWPPNYVLTQPEEGIAYLKINSFGSDNFKEKIDSLYPTILQSSGLIIDLRENGGGDSRNAEYLVSHLTAMPYLNSKWQVRQYTPAFLFKDKITWVSGGAEEIPPIANKKIYKGAVAVLIGPRTFSAAEDFLVAFDNAQIGTKIGSPTAGSTGQQIYFDLPGGGFARVCAKKDTYPDGKAFVGKGIIPDIKVNISLDDVQKGRDVILDKALNIIRKQISGDIE